MSPKTPGRNVRPPGDGDDPARGLTGTQLFPAPPRPSRSDARPLDPAGAGPDASAPAVSVLRTVGIEDGRSVPRASATPIRAANEPTRIFVVSPALVTERDASASGAARSLTETFATPAFSAVPNAVGSRPPQAKDSKPFARSTAPASTEVNRAQQTANAPLLRAFDDARPRANTWSTAQTITAPMSDASEEKAHDEASAGPKEAAARKPRAASLQQHLGRLRMSPGAAKKIVTLTAASVTVVGLGTLVGSMAKGVTPAQGSTKAAVAAPAAAHVEPNAAVQAATSPPKSELPPSSSPLPDSAAPDPSLERAPALTSIDVEPVHAEPLLERPSSAPGGSGSHQLTLARQAVDALLAGDRPKALQHYRELSSKAPDHTAYREAVRLLTASAATSHSLRSP